MLTQCKINPELSLPEDTAIVTVPKTRYVLECKRWQNKKWQVKLLDPTSNKRKELWRSMPDEELEQIVIKLGQLDSYKKMPGLIHAIKALKSKKASKSKKAKLSQKKTHQNKNRTKRPKNKNG